MNYEMYFEKIQSLIDNISILQQGWEKYSRPILILAIALGLVFCLFGYQLRKLWMCLMGFALGAAAGGSLGHFIIKDPKMTLIFGLVAAVILTGVFYYNYRESMFLLCAGMAYVTMRLILTSPKAWIHGVCLVAAVAAGLLVLKFEREILILITSVCGGVGAAAAGAVLTHKGRVLLVLMCGLTAALVGILFQFLNPWSRRSYQRQRDEKEENRNFFWEKLKNRKDGGRKKKDGRKKKRRRLWGKKNKKQKKNGNGYCPEKSRNAKPLEMNSQGTRDRVPEWGEADFQNVKPGDVKPESAVHQGAEDMGQRAEAGRQREILDLDDVSLEISQEVLKIYQEQQNEDKENIEP